eukprot:11169692-Lingulodinium_polyedra.AAC.1
MFVLTSRSATSASAITAAQPGNPLSPEDTGEPLVAEPLESLLLVGQRDGRYPAQEVRNGVVRVLELGAQR